MAPFSEQIKAEQYHKQVSENLWPDLLLPGVGSPSAEQAGLWSGELAQLSEAFTASLSDLTKNTFHHIKLYLFQRFGCSGASC